MTNLDNFLAKLPLNEQEDIRKLTKKLLVELAEREIREKRSEFKDLEGKIEQ